MEWDGDGDRDGDGLVEVTVFLVVSGACLGGGIHKLPVLLLTS